MHRLILLLLLALAWSGAVAAAEPIGQVKTLSGTATVVHQGSERLLAAGDRVFEGDIVATGPDGAVGITFADNAMLSLGPSSQLVLDRFSFNTTTHEGAFDSSLVKGTLAVKSGQIVEQQPEAMTVRTPAAILAVRGTAFVVRADGGS
jgi:hypothetical protein